MTAVIECEQLRKEYRRLRKGTSTAIAGLDLSVPEGGVFGFLGPNGSGKTTTIRCLLGLVSPTAGRVRLLGSAVPGGLAAVIDRVGAIVEAPALFPNMSAVHNVEILARSRGISRAKVDEVIGRVGLSERAGQAVGGYSLGMRQRLALAIALLKDPALLILDEPMNGLDPAGMKEVRDLIREIGDEGRTVFLSSHLLTEVQQVCDHVAILGRGRLIVEGRVADVLARSSQQAAIVVRAAGRSASEIGSALSAASIVHEIAGDDVRVAVEAASAARVNEVLGTAGIWASHLVAEQADLESVFLELTRHDDLGVPRKAPGRNKRAQP